MLLESLWAILKGYGKAVGKWPNTPAMNQKRGGKIAKWLLAKTWQCPFISPEALHLCQDKLKIKDTLSNFKNSQQLLS
jgi:hypothetical protein